MGILIQLFHHGYTGRPIAFYDFSTKDKTNGNFNTKTKIIYMREGQVLQRDNSYLCVTIFSRLNNIQVSFALFVRSRVNRENGSRAARFTSELMQE